MSKQYLSLDGIVETESNSLDWLEAFTDWLERRGETFGGGAMPVDENGDPIYDKQPQQESER